jgi:hypothetical protein
MHLEIPGTLQITWKGSRVLLRNVAKPKLMCRPFALNAGIEVEGSAKISWRKTM